MMSGKQKEIGRWCHFSQRVQRFPLNKGMKLGARVNWEDEKFSYLIIWKRPIDENGEFADPKKDQTNFTFTKMISQVMRRGKHVIMDGCTEEGDIQRITVSKATSKSQRKDSCILYSPFFFLVSSSAEREKPFQEKMSDSIAKLKNDKKISEEMITENKKKIGSTLYHAARRTRWGDDWLLSDLFLANKTQEENK
jgi:ribosomal protein RSM22 (predicted rRNA methylase)